MNPSPRIGVIGVGNMGLGIALRLREQGLEVTVRDIDAARDSLLVAAALALPGCDRAAMSRRWPLNCPGAASTRSTRPCPAARCAHAKAA